jgi:hypothetical protein
MAAGTRGSVTGFQILGIFIPRLGKRGAKKDLKPTA